MNENKPVTAEEISRTIGLLNSMVECGESHSEISSQMVSNALVATQQLTAKNEALKIRIEENRKSFRADLHHLRKHKAKLTEANQKLSVENEQWKKLAEIASPEKWVEVYKHYQDLLTREDALMFTAKTLQAENERLREVFNGYLETLKADLANAVELQEQQVGEEFNRGREAGLTYAIEMLLAQAGINLTHKEDGKDQGKN